MTRYRKKTFFQENSIYLLDNSVPLYSDGRVKLQILDKPPPDLPYRKLSSTHYVNTETGEVFEYRKSGSRAENLSTIRSSMNALRMIIEENVVGGIEVHGVFTFSNPEYNFRNLYPVTKNFIARLRKKHPLIEYISVPEAHEDGSYHLHLILKNGDGSRLFIPHAELSQIWGHGRVWVRRIVKKDYIASYLTSGAFNTDEGKGSRLLRYYPSHGRLFRYSRGIKKVRSIRMSYEQAQEFIGNRPLTFAKTIHVVRDNGDDTETELTNVTYKHYSPME